MYVRRAQLVLEGTQLPFQVEGEAGGGRLAALATGRVLERPQQVGEGDQIRPEAAVPFHVPPPGGATADDAGPAPCFSQPPTIRPTSFTDRAAKP